MTQNAIWVLAIFAFAVESAIGAPPNPNVTPAANETLDDSSPRLVPHYRLLESTPGSYELIWRPRQENVWPDHELIRQSQGGERPASGPWIFNWVARRDPMFIVSGDLPRFALMRTYRLPDLNPHYAKIGDLRIRVKFEGRTYWLDEVNPIVARFFPWGTIHEAQMGQDNPCTIRVLTTLVQNRGIAIRVDVTTDSAEESDIALELFYGGLTVKEPQLSSSYIREDSTDSQDDLVKATAEGGQISARLDLTSPLFNAPTATPETVEVISAPLGTVEVTSLTNAEEPANRLVFRHRFKTHQAPYTVRLIAFPTDPALKSSRQADIRIDQFDEYVAETQGYYNSLLQSVAIRTPDSILDSAFSAAAVNLDYTYQAPAWVEGLHKWNSYLVNNYQISAAIGIGQIERARDALLLYGTRPEGPGYNLKADGSIYETGGHKFEEGLIYYLLQLHRYWQATDDRETLDKLWEPAARNFERMLKVRDPDGNLLINWHAGCNMFLYQADHLSLPGDASSPSIMATDILERMADLAEARGELPRANAWRRRAEYMRSEVLRRLWNSDRGKFVASIDTQGLLMAANYYTDFVYPQLYSRLPVDYSWICLKTLDRTLWLENGLMRTGDFKPPLFGNDQVHPVQMSEASEAYFQMGRASEGVKLLNGVARAVTLFTDSPGSFPERLSDSGFGQPDYGFGNPAGAYARAVISGLFGFERMAPDHPQTWHPAIPAEWESASLRASDVEMAIRGRHGDRSYEFKSSSRHQALNLRIPLYGHRVEKVMDAAGHELQFTQLAHPGGGFVELQLQPAEVHTVRLVSSVQKMEIDVPTRVESGESVRWKLPEREMTVTDCQSSFDEYRVEGDTLVGKLAKAEGRRHLFLTSRKNDVITPIELDFGESETPKLPILFEGKRTAISLEKYFNSDSINVQNWWSGGPSKLTLKEHLRRDASGPNLKVGRFSFDVTSADKNVIQLAIGDLTSYELEIAHLSDKPQSISIPVGKSVRGLEFLMASDFKIRLTNMQVGRLILHYADGAQETEPLIYGRNIDSYMKHFADGVDSLELTWLSYLAAFSVEADPSRILSRVELKIDVVDGNLGIIAANVVLPNTSK